MSTYTAPGQEPRQRRFRQGDVHMGEKANAIFDRYRGMVVFIWPILLVVFAAFALDIITPADRFSAITRDLLALEIKNAEQDKTMVKTDSAVAAINEKLDLLVDLACDRLTKDQRVVTRRVVTCSAQ